MLFQDYLKATGKSLQRAAAELNMSWVTLWRWTKGKAQPTAESIRIVVKWSGGAITTDDMLAISGPAVAREAKRKAAAKAKAKPVEKPASKRVQRRGKAS